MTIPKQQPTPPSGAGRDLPPREVTALQGEAVALLHRWALDASEFEIRVHMLRDTAEFGTGTALLTIANRRERSSRTYLCDAGAVWTREFEQDVCAGVFGDRRVEAADLVSGAPANAAAVRPGPVVGQHALTF